MYKNILVCISSVSANRLNKYFPNGMRKRLRMGTSILLLTSSSFHYTSFAQSNSQLASFTNLTGTWHKQDANAKSLTKWFQQDDSSYVSYRIDSAGTDLKIVPGFKLMYSREKGIELIIKKYRWKLQSELNSEYTFANDTGAYKKVVFRIYPNSWTVFSVGTTVDTTIHLKYDQVDKEVDSLVAKISKTVSQKSSPSAQNLLNKRAPLFAGITPEEKEIQLANLKGRVVVINFWYTTCIPCVKEMPVLNKLTTKFNKQEVSFIGINWNTIEETKEFLKKHEFKFQLLANRTDIIDQYLRGATAFPTTFLIDKKGIIREIFSGSSGIANVEAKIEQLTKED